VFRGLSGETIVVRPLQSRCSTASGNDDLFKRRVAAADIRKPCAELREVRETSPRTGASRMDEDGNAGAAKQTKHAPACPPFFGISTRRIHWEGWFEAAEQRWAGDQRRNETKVSGLCPALLSTRNFVLLACSQARCYVTFSGAGTISGILAPRASHPFYK